MENLKREIAALKKERPSLAGKLASLEAASRNTSRAVGTIHTADPAMAEVSDLLNQIRSIALPATRCGKNGRCDP